MGAKVVGLAANSTRQSKGGAAVRTPSTRIFVFSRCVSLSHFCRLGFLSSFSLSLLSSSLLQSLSPIYANTLLLLLLSLQSLHYPFFFFLLSPFYTKQLGSPLSVYHLTHQQQWPPQLSTPTPHSPRPRQRSTSRTMLLALRSLPRQR